MTEQPATSRTETPMADGYQTREEAEQRIEELRSEVERLRAERARAVEALGSIGRTAVAATGDLEDGINAELIARERADGDIPDLREQFTAAIIDDLAQCRPDAAPDHDERQAARELAEVLAPIAESAVERLRVERDEARKQLATATNALYWVGYQLSKHVDYGGDIQDAHDTARDAYRRITSDGTEAGQ